MRGDSSEALALGRILGTKRSNKKFAQSARNVKFPLFCRSGDFVIFHFSNRMRSKNWAVIYKLGEVQKRFAEKFWQLIHQLVSVDHNFLQQFRVNVLDCVVPASCRACLASHSSLSIRILVSLDWRAPLQRSQVSFIGRHWGLRWGLRENLERHGLHLHWLRNKNWLPLWHRRNSPSLLQIGSVESHNRTRAANKLRLHRLKHLRRRGGQSKAGRAYIGQRCVAGGARIGRGAAVGSRGLDQTRAIN